MSIKPITISNKSNGTASAEDIKTALVGLKSPNKLPATAIENGVLSVNNSTGNVVITPEIIGAQSKNVNLDKVSSLTLSPNSLLYTDGNSGLLTTPLSNYSKALLALTGREQLASSLQLGNASFLNVNVPNGVLQLDSQGKIPQSLLGLTLSAVAYSGSYNDLENQPKIFSGNYEDLANKPDLFSGSYSDLSNTPTLFSGSYNDLSDKPVITDGQMNPDWEAVDGPSAIMNKPELFSGRYADLVNKPDIPTDTSQMTNSAGFVTMQQVETEMDFVKSINGSSGEVNISAPDIGAASIDHRHALNEVNGLLDALSAKMDNSSPIPYSRLTGTPTIPASQVNSDWLAESGSSEILNKPILFDGDYTSLRNKPDIPVVNYPVTSVNSKIGDITLNAADIGASLVGHKHVVSDVTGLQTALDSKMASNAIIPYASLSGAPTIPTNTNQLTNGSGFITAAQASGSSPVQSVNGKTGAVVISAADIGAMPSTSVMPTKTSQLTNDSGYITSVPVNSVNGKTGAVILTATDVGAVASGSLPTKTSQLTNDSGFITTSPVASVNGKTGAITLSATDIGAATSAQGTRYYRAAGTQATGVKVKYYTVVSDTNGAWSLSLGTDFTEVLDVQAQAVSTAGVTGVRQSTVNAFTSNSTTITGMTWGNTVIVTILLSGTNSLSLTPNTPVRIRVEGVGP